MPQGSLGIFIHKNVRNYKWTALSECSSTDFTIKKSIFKVLAPTSYAHTSSHESFKTYCSRQIKVPSILNEKWNGNVQLKTYSSFPLYLLKGRFFGPTISG